MEWSRGSANGGRPGVPAYRMVAVQRPVVAGAAAAAAGETGQVDFTGVVVLLVRLEARGTDVVVAVNVPHVRGQYEVGEVDIEAGREGGLMEVGREIMERVRLTFKVVDWGLFGEA